MKVCRDIIRVIYPLYNKKTGLFSGFYTCTIYDIYILNKIKYVRGKPLFYAKDLSNKPKHYSSLDSMPACIEESKNYSKWKFKYSILPVKDNNLIENYVTHLWLSGKL